MKNKKLFAILTLVCFMFTLMPMAAFAAKTYAEVDSDYDVVKAGSENVKINVTNGVTTTYYAFALNSDGKLSDDGFQTIGISGGMISIADAGTYTVFVAPKTVATEAVVNSAEKTKAEKVALLKDSAVTMLDNKVTVKPVSKDYKIKLYVGDTEVSGITVGANSGYTSTEVKAVLTTAVGEEVVGAELTISTNSDAVTVSKTSATTNAAGVASFKVSASTAGTYKVYVEYGTKADATLTVKAGALDAAKIAVYTVSNTLVALGQDVIKAEAFFTVTDINGNAITAETGDRAAFAYKVKVAKKPVGSTADGDSAYLMYNKTAGAWLLGGIDLDEAGDYTFQVVLDNGSYANVNITAKEFGKPVELKMTYKQNAVELNGEAILDKLYYVDANGVTKSLLTNGKVTGDVTLAASGYAVAGFDKETGKVTVKADEKYVGSKITVAAVSSKYNLTTAVELTVANEASTVKYANTKVDVAVNNTLTGNIVDQDGNKVALNGEINNANISYVVLEKPEGAKVAVTTQSEQLAAKGQFKASFTASTVGTYKLQTIVTYEQASGVVKYYSGVETITVGNTGFEDIVVMSIGSNEIIVNSTKVVIDAAPIISNNRTFVPFRALAEAFGANVAYDEATQAVTAELNGAKVVMTIGSATYTVNGAEKTADVAPFINGSRTMVPVRFAAEAFGITVTPTYDENGATADVLFAK